jgi:hypothetical protein
VDARTVSRVVGASCLVAGPLAAVGYELVTPVDAGSPNVARQLAEIDANRTAMNLAPIFGTVALLLIPAVLFAASSARRRTPGVAIAAASIGAALWRAHVLPAWAAAGLVVAIPVEVAGVVSGAGHAAGAIAYGLVATAFLLCALRLLRTPNDGWDLAPVP